MNAAETLRLDAAETLRLMVRRHDPDRYFCALFAPEAARHTLFTLYAFNHELARATEVARHPGLALIRLQWWREVVEGAARKHEVATPVRTALDEGLLRQGDLLAMIEAREQEAEADFPTLDDWRAWLMLGGGSLAMAAAAALGAPDDAMGRMRELGGGFAVAGQLRSIAAFAAGGRCLLPADVLELHGLSQEAVIGGPGAAAMGAVRAALAECGQTLLGSPRGCPRAWIAAGLPAILARRDLRHPERPPGPHGMADRLAVVRGALIASC